MEDLASRGRDQSVKARPKDRSTVRWRYGWSTEMGDGDHTVIMIISNVKGFNFNDSSRRHFGSMREVGYLDLKNAKRMLTKAWQ